MSIDKSTGNKPGFNAAKKGSRQVGFQSVVPVKFATPTAALDRQSPVLIVSGASADENQINKNYEKFTIKRKIVNAGKAKILDKTEYLNHLLELGINTDLASEVALRLADAPPFLIATTGKLASGKDTIAPAVFQKIGALDPTHLSFAAPLKDEVDELFTLVRSTRGKTQCITKAMEFFGIDEAKATHMVNLVYRPARARFFLRFSRKQYGQDVTARDRTPWTRLALQYWGVEVRREQDPDYWVKKGISSAAQAIVKGENIMITDVRFPGEVEACQSIGFTVVRLEVSPETQGRRLFGRDGLAPDPKALIHPTEIALDNYHDFNIIIDNNKNTVEQTVDAIVAKFV